MSYRPVKWTSAQSPQFGWSEENNVVSAHQKKNPLLPSYEEMLIGLTNRIADYFSLASAENTIRTKKPGLYARAITAAALSDKLLGYEYRNLETHINESKIGFSLDEVVKAVCGVFKDNLSVISNRVVRRRVAEVYGKYKEDAKVPKIHSSHLSRKAVLSYVEAVVMEINTGNRTYRLAPIKNEGYKKDKSQPRYILVPKVFVHKRIRHHKARRR